MKKIFLIPILCIFACFVSSNAYAEFQMYKTTGFAMKQLKPNGYWTPWSDWEKSDMALTIDTDNDIVKIHSPSPQTYAIIKYIRNYTDSDGGKQIEYQFIDQDGDVGTLR